MAYLSNRLSEVTTYNEAELLQGLQAHDEQAFSYLYDHYSKALFAVILPFVQQQDVAEDILQEVFVKVWQHIQSYNESKGRLYTWMLNIARNHAIDRIRSKDFNNQSKTTALPINVYNNADGDSRIGDVGLKKTLSNLPDDSRVLLELAYFQGYTHDEIAKITGLPLGTIKTRLRNTIIKLRKILTILFNLWI
jgi:RNA polymerase sigma factor (sigma-70 family)